MRKNKFIPAILREDMNPRIIEIAVITLVTSTVMDRNTAITVSSRGS